MQTEMQLPDDKCRHAVERSSVHRPHESLHPRKHETLSQC